MFQRKRKVVNSPSEYEKIPDSEEEHEEEQYEPDSPDSVSEGSSVLPAGAGDAPKYL